MTSNATTVNEYLAELSEDRRAALSSRALAHTLARDSRRKRRVATRLSGWSAASRQVLMGSSR